MAAAVSGHAYTFDDNVLGFRRFRLSFEDERVIWQFAFRGKTVEVEVGIDGQPRMTESEGYIRSYSGRWSSDNTFAMSYEIMGTEESGGIEISFSADTATVLFYEHGTETREVILARRHGAPASE